MNYVDTPYILLSRMNLCSLLSGHQRHRQFPVVIDWVPLYWLNDDIWLQFQFNCSGHNSDLFVHCTGFYMEISRFKWPLNEKILSIKMYNFNFLVSNLIKIYRVLRKICVFVLQEIDSLIFHMEKWSCSPKKLWNNIEISWKTICSLWICQRRSLFIQKKKLILG